MSASNALDRALRLLTVRALTVSELRARLRKTKFEETQIENAIKRCSELNYLSDDRTAADYASALLRRGYGPKRTALTMRKRGFSRELTEREVNRSAEEERPVIAKLLEMKQENFLKEKDRIKRLNQVKNFLIRRGFSAAACQQEMGRFPALFERGEDVLSTNSRETPDLESCIKLLQDRSRRFARTENPRKRREQMWRFLFSKGAPSGIIKEACRRFGEAESEPDEEFL